MASATAVVVPTSLPVSVVTASKGESKDKEEKADILFSFFSSPKHLPIQYDCLFQNLIAIAITSFLCIALGEIWICYRAR